MDEGPRFSELRTQNFELLVAPVAHDLLVSLMLHIQESAGIMKSAWAQAFLKRSSASAA